jgi:hypothetical protein
MEDEELLAQLWEMESSIDVIIANYFQSKNRPVKILEYKSLLTKPLNEKKKWWQLF